LEVRTSPSNDQARGRSGSTTSYRLNFYQPLPLQNLSAAGYLVAMKPKVGWQIVSKSCRYDLRD
jgi:hypothetical protein